MAHLPATDIKPPFNFFYPEGKESNSDSAYFVKRLNRLGCPFSEVVFSGEIAVFDQKRVSLGEHIFKHLASAFADMEEAMLFTLINRIAQDQSVGHAGYRGIRRCINLGTHGARSRNMSAGRAAAKEEDDTATFIGWRVVLRKEDIHPFQ